MKKEQINNNHQEDQQIHPLVPRLDPDLLLRTQSTLPTAVMLVNFPTCSLVQLRYCV
jgi:hypothetical protein